MSAAGRVATGFSLPYVATYANNGGTVTYSNGQKLARGVNVNITPESSSDNIFYADNQAAESAAGTFTGGQIELEVDGLLMAAERLVYGAPAAGTDGWTEFGDSAQVPNVGLVYIVRWMSDSVVTYQAIVHPKVKFDLPEQEFATQEDEIDWQTSSITATLMRDDTSNHNWKLESAEFATEALAEAALKTKLGIST